MAGFKPNTAMQGLLLPCLWEEFDLNRDNYWDIIIHHITQLTTGVQLELEIHWMDGTITFERYVKENKW